MYVHEIVAVRKGADKTRKIVELNMIKREARNDTAPKYEGLEISNTIHLEGTTDELEEAFGKGFDVGDQVVLATLKFDSYEEE